jgi:ribosomal protein S12 methylthiotransferase
MMPSPVRRFHVETLGCPKNAVDSDKVTASLLADGLVAASSAAEADLVVVNTCAFIEAARVESIETTIALAEGAKPGARVVVTGCMAERYGAELAAALPEVHAVVGFAGEGSLAAAAGFASVAPTSAVAFKRKPTGVRDLLELPRAAPLAPWAYLKVAEGCDRACAFCAIPSFRGAQRSRTPESVVAEARGLVDGGVAELVLVAQDLAWYGRDIGAPGSLTPLLRQLDELSASGLARIRLLYLYPSEVRDPLVSTMLELPTVVPYFDLSLQHASRPLLRRMARWGDGDRFTTIIASIRAQRPDAAFRSSFIVGFPGETEDDHDELLQFLGAVELDWAGFFPFSKEQGTAAESMDGAPEPGLVAERLRECAALQDPITAARRDALIGSTVEVLVDRFDETSGVVVGRTHREAPEIDGIVTVRGVLQARPGALIAAVVTGATGADLEAEPAVPVRVELTVPASDHAVLGSVP